MEFSPNSSATSVLPQSGAGSKLYLYGLTLFMVIGAILWFWVGENPNSKEPPQVSSKIPLIGHLLGIIQHQAEYFLQLNSHHSWPIYTLKIFSSRVYVITSPDLIQAVFRNSKNLSFDPIADRGTARIVQIRDEHMKKLGVVPAESQVSHRDSIMKGLHVSLQAGAPLLQMNSRALNRFASFLDNIDTTEKPINLHRWVRDNFSLASADAMYGPENPIAEDSSLIQAMEDFANSLGILFLNILPSITARKGHLARRAYAKAFRSYYSRGLLKNASALVRGRSTGLAKSGIDYNDVAAMEIGIYLAASVNSVNGAFWMLCRVFSDTELMSEIRAEVLNITTRTAKDGVEEVCLDVSQLQNTCPLLSSTWQEVLRIDGVVVNQRVVLEDTLLDDAYFLKKNSLIQIPTRITHNLEDIWGPDSHTFNPRRFLKSNIDSLSREQRKLQKQGYNPFGGGAWLCPGRHFATTETLGVAATMLLGYDVRMADGSGPLRLPKPKKQEIGYALLIPETGLDVLIKRKKEFEGVHWTYDVGGDVKQSDMIF